MQKTSSSTKNNNLYIIISRIFDPLILLPLVYLLLLVDHELPHYYKVIIYILQVVIPLSVLAYLIHKGTTDIDLTQRESRLPFLTTTIICTVFTWALTYTLGQNDLTLAQTKIFAALLVFGTITVFWKISGHTTTNTFIGYLIIQYTPYLIPVIIILIAAITTSRLKLKKHTLTQALAGIILGLIFGYFW